MQQAYIRPSSFQKHHSSKIFGSSKSTPFQHVIFLLVIQASITHLSTSNRIHFHDVASGYVKKKKILYSFYDAAKFTLVITTFHHPLFIRYSCQSAVFKEPPGKKNLVLDLEGTHFPQFLKRIGATLEFDSFRKRIDSDYRVFDSFKCPNQFIF